MTKRLSLFAGWCLLLLAGSLVTSADAWSLYSDEENQTTVQTSGGPTHK